MASSPSSLTATSNTPPSSKQRWAITNKPSSSTASPTLCPPAPAPAPGSNTGGDPACVDPGRAILNTLAGRVTFLALDQPPLPDLSPPKPDAPPDVRIRWTNVPAIDPHLRPVIDLVRYPAWLGPVAWRLLGRTLIVRDLGTALMLRATLPAPLPGARATALSPRRVKSSTKTAGSSPAPMNAASGGGGLISPPFRVGVAGGRAQSNSTRSSASDSSTLSAISDQAAHLEKVTSQLQQSLFNANALKAELTSRLDSLAFADREPRKGAAGHLRRGRRPSTVNSMRPTPNVRPATAARPKRLEQQSAAREARRAALEAEIAEASEAADTAREQVTSLRIDASKLAEQLARPPSARPVSTPSPAADLTRQHTRLLCKKLKPATHNRIADLEGQVGDRRGKLPRVRDRKVQELVTQCELVQSQGPRPRTRFSLPSRADFRSASVKGRREA